MMAMCVTDLRQRMRKYEADITTFEREQKRAAGFGR